MFKILIERLLRSVDVNINGQRPWDITVYNRRLFPKVLCEANLGLGEAYMDGWWDCPALDQFFYRICGGGIENRFRFSLPVMCGKLAYALVNLQSAARAPMVAVQHYDFGNAMFQSMLDPYMQYSCGYWEHAGTLEEAQRRKMEMICRKLELEPGMHVLDVGCGWGGLGRYMARNYGVRVTGVTVSRQQADYARNHSQGLDVEWLLEDYRSLTGTYDRVVSVGMFEHVGFKNYRTYMEKIHSLLPPHGLFLLHTIGANKTMHSVDPWISKYIFTNGVLPSMEQIGHAAAGLFVMEDWHSFGANYDKTLMAWEENFNTGREKGAFSCSERIGRMFRYYLLSCAGAFRARDLQVWQIVFSPSGLPGGYERPLPQANADDVPVIKRD